MNPQPPPPGQRVFSCGHSFHVFVPPILDEIAKSAGIKNHVTVGVSSIGGSRVIEHWDVPDEQNQAKAALNNRGDGAGKVDVLTLSPIWLPDEGIEKFVLFAAQHNPDIRVTVQEYWLPNDEYVPVYPLETFKKTDHNAATGAELRRRHEPYFRDIDAVARDLNRRLGKQTVLIVPVGQAVIPLREKIIRGQAPGLTTQEDLFADSWGHATQPIQLLNAYCHFAVIYGRSPVGLPTPSVLISANRLGWDQKLNELLQQLAWDAVTQHPLSGVRESDRQD